MSTNVFSWLFSNPFTHESDTVPLSQTIAPWEKSRPIFVDDASDRKLAYSRLRDDALTIASNLRALDLNPEAILRLPPTPTCRQPEVAPVVLIQLPNCLPYATCVLGVWAAGLTSTLVSPALTATEVAWVLQNSRPQAIITAKSCLAPIKEALAAQEDRAYFAHTPIFTVDVAADQYPNPANGSVATETSVQDWRSLLKQTDTPRPEAHAISPAQAETRTAVILWSSGTSGRPKGMLLSHRALTFSAASLWHDSDNYAVKPQQQRWLGYVPFYHIFGLSNIFLMSICTGTTVYTMTNFKLDRVLAAIPRRQITYMHMAPPVAVMLAKSPLVEPYVKKNAFASVVAGVTGGAPLGHEIVAQVFRRLGFLVRLGYGMSEACSITLQRGVDEAAMNSYTGDTGAPHFGVEVTIAADDNTYVEGTTTKSAPEGSTGEVLVRSPGLLSGYIPKEGLIEATPGQTLDTSTTQEAITPDGWLRTGDVGHMNAAGVLHITDRLKELIKVQAYQVAPAELEAILCGSPAVADAGVIGVYDSDAATEWPRGFVVPADPDRTRTKESAKEFGAELRTLVERHATRYKWLLGGIVFVDKIPKSPSGKILRRVLREGGAAGIEVDVYANERRQRSKKREQKL